MPTNIAPATRPGRICSTQAFVLRGASDGTGFDVAFAEPLQMPTGLPEREALVAAGCDYRRHAARAPSWYSMTGRCAQAAIARGKARAFTELT